MTMTTRLFALLGSALMLSFLAITTVEAGYRGGRMGGGFHGGGLHGGGFHRGGFHGARMYNVGIHRMAPRMMAPRMMAPRMAYRPAVVHRGFYGGGYRLAHAPARIHVARHYVNPMRYAYGGHPQIRVHYANRYPLVHSRPVMMRPVYAHAYNHAPRFAPARPMYRPAPHMMRPAAVHRMPAPSRYMGGHHMHQRMAMAGYKRHH